MLPWIKLLTLRPTHSINISPRNFHSPPCHVRLTMMQFWYLRRLSWFLKLPTDIETRRVRDFGLKKWRFDV